jgi:hypothetical protein
MMYPQPVTHGLSRTASGLDQGDLHASNGLQHRARCWWPLWFLSLVAFIASESLLSTAGRLAIKDYVQVYQTLLGVVISALSLMTLYHAARIMIVERPRALIAAYISAFGGFLKHTSNWLLPALNFIALANLLQSYTLIKKIITTLKPFSWDGKLLAADKWLHFGVDPWRITHGLFASDFAAYVLNFNYHVWFAIVLGFLSWGIVGQKHEQLRAQFLLSAMALWVISGNLIAIYFSSAGPCFFNHLGQDDALYFQPLMQHLAQSHASLQSHGWQLGLPAVPLQHQLWHDYVTSGGMFGGGISAFPSMHVAMAVSVALVASRLNRWLGGAAWLFALAIQIGSVHLGWHYAVDGYASTLLAIVFWKVSGRVIRLTSPS